MYASCHCGFSPPGDPIYALSSDDDGDDDIGDDNDDNDDRTGQPVEVERTAFIAFIEKEQVRGVHCIFKLLYLTSNIMVRGVHSIQDFFNFICVILVVIWVFSFSSSIY